MFDLIKLLIGSGNKNRENTGFRGFWMSLEIDNYYRLRYYT